MTHVQVIHFIRHGQGYHNVAGHNDPARYLEWEFEDAHLTELGWEQACMSRSLPACVLLTESARSDFKESACAQAHALRAHIAGQPESVEVDAVIVSPLSRALQTAVGAFGQSPWVGPKGGPALMIQQHAVQVNLLLPSDSQQSLWLAWLQQASGSLTYRASRWSMLQWPHQAARPSLPGRCVVIALPHAAATSIWLRDLRPSQPKGEGAAQYCREHLGRHPCDRRRSLAHLREQYPAVDFSLVRPVFLQAYLCARPALTSWQMLLVWASVCDICDFFCNL